ncbi:MAG: T9SS type A sorting domain-containing protein [Ignavibacteriaceae bacterium]|nr:T9SS type A sorting domain-containing protein [Ignavibacteriaceae bacterium]
MLKRVFTLCTLLLFASGLLLAQDTYVLTPSGKMYKNNEVKKVTSKLVPHVATSKTAPANVLGAPDTLEYRSLFPASGNSNFGFFSRDIGVQWFVAPTQIKIKAVGFTPYENTDGAGAEIKIVKFGWTKAQLDTCNHTNRWGYYPAVGNNFNDITGFYDNADRTGDWVDISGNGVPSPFAEDIWSDAGQGAPIVPENPGGVAGYQWVEMSLLAFEPIVDEGEVFGVVMSNVAPNLTASTDRVGLYAATISSLPPAFKFYANGRLVVGPDGDKGWWSRDFTWDMKVAVELLGDVSPTIVGFNQVNSGLSTDPQTITATITDGNPSGGPAGVASANIQYSTDNGTTYDAVAMSNTSGDEWSGVIPGQVPGTKVTYTVDATDVQGNMSTSLSSYTYLIFAPNPVNKTLVVFNGYDFKTSGYPQDYYFGIGDYTNYGTLAFNHDVWAYGPLSAELVNHYFNVIEISNSNGPAEYNDDVIRAWLAASNDNNYFLAGSEWLGSRYGYVNMDFAAGTFEYDILGITHSYNDVSYAASTGQELPSRLFPVAGSGLGDSLNTAFVATTADSLQYNPGYESSDGTVNWIDAYDVSSTATVDVNVETRGIDNIVNVQNLPAASHTTLAAGNKVAFMAYDPLYVNTSAPYTWLGFASEAPQVQALRWFGAVVVSVENNGVVPGTFNLSQNYPNPFNPSTLIEFAVAERSNVTLKIYDVLGREVATLVNTTKNAGSYKVNFDASKLASGLYVYTLNAGSFTSSKKMMLLK